VLNNNAHNLGDLVNVVINMKVEALRVFLLVEDLLASRQDSSPRN
jgi:sporulation protein YlmC with PRC-barrel domain